MIAACITTLVAVSNFFLLVPEPEKIGIFVDEETPEE